MESPLGFASTLFFASLFLLLSSPSPTNASTRLVESVCNEVEGILKGSNSECLKALELDPRTGSASTYEVLAPIAIDLAIANAKDSEAFIKNLLKNNSRSEAIKQCADSYNIVVRDFVGAKEELKEDPLSANYDIKIAGDNVGDCENALSSKGLQVPEIASRNHAIMFLYSNIGFVITNHID